MTRKSPSSPSKRQINTAAFFAVGEISFPVLSSALYTRSCCAKAKSLDDDPLETLFAADAGDSINFASNQSHLDRQRELICKVVTFCPTQVTAV